jgi:CBS domain-containing protein
MQLHEIMKTDVVTIGPKEPASAASSRMKRRRIRHLVVADSAGVAGLISERDLGGPDGSAVRKDRMVRDLMTPGVVTAGPETTLADAAELMLRNRIGSLPVLEDGRLVGIVTATDVLDELGREAQSSETPGTRKRAPFPARLPKALKPITGRTRAPLIPAHVRVVGMDLSGDEKEDIRRKLGKKLGKFAASIERVSVRVKDVNGPRGGVDQLCRIKVVLSDFPSVLFEHQEAALEPAIDSALAGAERAVRKALQRRRTKPLKAARARGPVQAG